MYAKIAMRASLLKPKAVQLSEIAKSASTGNIQHLQDRLLVNRAHWVPSWGRRAVNQ